MGSYAKIRPRRGTLYEWSTVNPILEHGELVVEYPDQGIGTGFCKFKIGDGTQHYNDLEYALDGASASGINGGGVETFHTICLRGGTEEEWTRVDPILQANEIAYDSTNNAFKVGDGTHKWSELEYTSSNSMDDIIECGDEDAVGTLSEILSNEDYPDSVFDETPTTHTATISDLLANASTVVTNEEETTEDPNDDQEGHNFTADETEDEQKEESASEATVESKDMEETELPVDEDNEVEPTASDTVESPSTNEISEQSDNAAVETEIADSDKASS